MGQELKVGQRIDVYNVVSNEADFMGIKPGNTYIGEFDDENDITLFSVPMEGCDPMMYYMEEHEVKKVGTFVVKSVNSNTEPITII